jgi:hypothetical protein
MMDENYEYLMTADNEVEAKIIESKLIFYEMEVMLEHQGAGALISILAGSSFGPVDIYVRKDQINEARELMDL